MRKYLLLQGAMNEQKCKHDDDGVYINYEICYKIQGRENVGQ